MTVYLLTISVAILYAFIRAKHDSYISHGKWKIWAFIEGVLVCTSVCVFISLGFGTPWWTLFVLIPLFAFYFWLFFDCVQGQIRAGSILHLGDKGFDAEMRAMFYYNLPIWGWKETGAIRLIFFKVFWIVLLSGAYFAMV